jgi:hypothetical protein
VTQLIDDQLLGSVLRGEQPPRPDARVFTTGYWYVRLCQAVLAVSDRPGILSGPFENLPADDRERAVQALIELPESIGLISLRELAPTIGRLRRRHQLNILGLEALAAALHLEAEVYLSAPSPRLQDALRHEGRRCEVLT